MKRFVFVLLMMFTFIYVNAAAKIWIGVSGGLWSVAGNWSPSGVPIAADDVIFNTNVVGEFFTRICKLH